MSKFKVLFLCSANSCRSQMAEAYLRRLAGQDFEACSAGTQPQPIHPLTIKVLQEHGISIEEQSSKPLEALAGQRFDLLVTVCDKAAGLCPVLPGGIAAEVLHMGFEDPASFQGDSLAVLDKFREVRDEIHRGVIALVHMLRERQRRSA
ncbi:arsenate reductase ArsC [bacterium]|nr:arsenate reductase ArsC [bacterium]